MKLGNNFAFKNAMKAEDTSSTSASIKGIGLKTLLLVFIMIVSTIFMMSNFHRFGGYALYIYVGVAIINFILQLIMCFVPSTTKVLSVPYSIFEGLMLGTVIGIVELVLPGEGFQLAGLALILTIAIFLAATILYTTGVIKVGHFFRGFMLSVLLGIMISSLVISVIGIFNPSIYTLLFSSKLGIIISVVMIIVAGLYVVISLDNATQIVLSGCDEKYEWYAAFGILLNIEWLFIEIFRLLLYLKQSSDK